MLTVICPYCEIGSNVILDTVLHDSINNKETTCICTNCNRTFIAFFKNDKLESKYDNNTAVILDK